MATDIEVYERLQPLVGDQVARRLADMAEKSGRLVTETVFRLEMQTLRAEFQQLRQEIQLEFAESRADTREWMLKFFVPLWIGVYGTIAAVAVSIIVRH
jgi:hypothetical protein